MVIREAIRTYKELTLPIPYTMHVYKTNKTTNLRKYHLEPDKPEVHEH